MGDHNTDSDSGDTGVQRLAVRKTKTGIPGVYVLINGKFGAQASGGGKVHWLGTFRSAKLAEAAVKKFKRESEQLAEEERRQRLALEKVLQWRGGEGDNPQRDSSEPPVLGRPFESERATADAHADVVKRTPRCPHCSMPGHFHMRLVNGSKVIIFSWTEGGPQDAFPIVGIFFDGRNSVGVAMTWSLTGEPYRCPGWPGQWLDFGTLERTAKTKDYWLTGLLPPLQTDTAESEELGRVASSGDEQEEEEDHNDDETGGIA